MPKSENKEFNKENIETFIKDIESDSIESTLFKSVLEEELILKVEDGISKIYDGAVVLVCQEKSEKETQEKIIQMLKELSEEHRTQYIKPKDRFVNFYLTMSSEEYNMCERIREDCKLPTYIKKHKHELVPHDYAAMLKVKQDNYDEEEKEVKSYFEKEEKRKKVSKNSDLTDEEKKEALEKCVLTDEEQKVVTEKVTEEIGKRPTEEEQEWKCKYCKKDGKREDERVFCKECSTSPWSLVSMCGDCYKKSLEGVSDEVKIPYMRIIDFSKGQGYYAPQSGKEEVSKENVLAFMSSVKKGEIEKQNFG